MTELKMTFVFKLAKTGFDADTCADKDLIMGAHLNMLKTKMVGTTAVPVAHGLAYVPIFFCMEKISATHYGIVGQNGWEYPYVNATNFVPHVESKYYIF